MESNASLDTDGMISLDTENTVNLRMDKIGSFDTENTVTLSTHKLCSFDTDSSVTPPTDNICSFDTKNTIISRTDMFHSFGTDNSVTSPTDKVCSFDTGNNSLSLHSDMVCLDTNNALGIINAQPNGDLMDTSTACSSPMDINNASSLDTSPSQVTDITETSSLPSFDNMDFYEKTELNVALDNQDNDYHSITPTFGFHTDFIRQRTMGVWLRSKDYNHPCVYKTCALSDQLINNPTAARFVPIYHALWQAGRPNFMSARIPIPSAINIPAWRYLLKDYSDNIICEYLEYGWPIGYQTDAWPHSTNINHKSALVHQPAVENYLQKELGHGAILGPFDRPPFFPFHSSPLMTAPKKSSDKRRVIVDLSWPKGDSVNSGIPRHTYLDLEYKLTLPTVDNFIEKILSKGQHSFMWRIDIQRAFRQLRADPLDHPLLCIQHKGQYYVDASVPFGLRTGAMFCQRFTDAIRFIMRNSYGRDILNYIDDFASVDTQYHAAASFNELRELLKHLGVPEAPDKLDFPSTRREFLGVIFDSDKLTIELPGQKLNDTLSLVKTWYSRRYATKKDIQALLGKLLHVAKCVRPARLFVGRMLDTLRQAPDAGTIKLCEDFQSDINWFCQFLPSYNGINMMQHTSPDFSVQLDSCLTGCGGIYDNEYYGTEFPSDIVNLARNITELEMLNIVVATQLWGNKWTGRSIRIQCDNEPCVYVLNTGRSRNTFLLTCARKIWMVSARHDFVISAVHIKGSDNTVADALSRRHMGNHAARTVNNLLDKSLYTERFIDPECFHCSSII